MSLIPSFFGNRRRKADPFFPMDIWDPFRNFPIQPSSELLPGFPRETSQFVNTRVDWKETPEAHVFRADLPGIKKEEVKVEIEDDRVLQIRGERTAEMEDKNDKWHRFERSSGQFLRRFRLPENAVMDQVKASMENGVLTVTIPKAEFVWEQSLNLPSTRSFSRIQGRPPGPDLNDKMNSDKAFKER